jgi:uncharacterized protein (TIGR02001 family)
MNKIALACGAALMGATAVAQAELSANIGVTSNYMFRGMSFTGDDAAVSGGLDYAHDSGFYIGTWASSLNSGTEVDLYLGFGGEAGSIGYDVGVIRYMYPETSNIAYSELYGSLSFSMFEVGLAYTIESESGNSGGQYDTGDIYYYASASTDIMDGFTLGGTVGHYEWDNDGPAIAPFGSYNHLDLTLSKDAGDFGEFSFLVSFADKEANGDNDTNFAVSWGKTF